MCKAGKDIPQKILQAVTAVNAGFTKYWLRGVEYKCTPLLDFE